MKSGLLMLMGVLILPGFLTGCYHQSSSSSSSLYTEDDVRKFMLPGTSREAIEQRFGRPMEDDRHPKFVDGSTNIDEILYYVLILPPESMPRGKFVFSGFEVHLRDGKAIKWTPSQAIRN